MITPCGEFCVGCFGGQLQLNLHCSSSWGDHNLVEWMLGTRWRMIFLLFGGDDKRPVRWPYTNWLIDPELTRLRDTNFCSRRMQKVQTCKAEVNCGAGWACAAGNLLFANKSSIRSSIWPSEIWDVRCTGFAYWHWTSIVQATWFLWSFGRKFRPCPFCWVLLQTGRPTPWVKYGHWCWKLSNLLRVSTPATLTILAMFSSTFASRMVPVIGTWATEGMKLALPQRRVLSMLHWCNPPAVLWLDFVQWQIDSSQGFLFHLLGRNSLILSKEV